MKITDKKALQLISFIVECVNHDSWHKMFGDAIENAKFNEAHLKGMVREIKALLKEPPKKRKRSRKLTRAEKEFVRSCL